LADATPRFSFQAVFVAPAALPEPYTRSGIIRRSHVSAAKRADPGDDISPVHAHRQRFSLHFSRSGFTRCREAVLAQGLDCPVIDGARTCAGSDTGAAGMKND